MNRIQLAEAMARQGKPSRQELKGASYINGSVCLATVEPSVWRVQILSSENGGWREKRAATQKAPSEGLELPMAAAGSGRDPWHEKTGITWTRKNATRKGREAPVAQVCDTRRDRGLECHPQTWPPGKA